MPPLPSAGSSPRVRGKRGQSRTVRATVRIIPARAGQTGVHAQVLHHYPDHPRACGANQARTRNFSKEYGSSPRVRGKQTDGTKLDVSNRIIPARAGQTVCSYRTCPCCTDHPRACGANLISACRYPLVHGSSPRVRGKPPGRSRVRR